jgi:hypothetical protein
MKTATEWLFENLFEEREDGQLLYQLEEDIVGLFEKAKEIEREQIINAFNQDLYSQSVDRMRYQDGLEYYSETYGK